MIPDKILQRGEERPSSSNMDSVDIPKQIFSEKDVLKELVEWCHSYPEHLRSYEESNDKKEAARDLLKFRLSKEPNYIFLLPETLLEKIGIRIDKNPVITKKIESLRSVINGKVLMTLQLNQELKSKKIDDSEKAIGIYSNSHSLGIFKNIYNAYCLRTNVLGPERDYIRDPIRINIKDGAIIFTKRRIINRWKERFGDDISRNIKIIKEWKVGCQAILLARDSITAERILERMNNAVLNCQQLRVPGLGDEQKEKFFKEYSFFRENLQLEREKNEREKALQNPILKEAYELLNKINKYQQNLVEIKNDLDGCIKDERRTLNDIDVFLGGANIKNPKVEYLVDHKEKASIDLSFYDRHEEFDEMFKNRTNSRGKRFKKISIKKQGENCKKVVDDIFNKLGLQHKEIFGLTKKSNLGEIIGDKKHNTIKENDPELDIENQERESSLNEKEEFARELLELEND